MSVTIINESWKGRGGSYQADGTREHEGVLDVYTSSSSDDDTTIRLALSQSVFAQHPNDVYAFLDSLDIRNDEQHPLKWKCTLRYTTRPRRKCGEIDQDPLQQPAEITWPTFHEEEIVEKATRVDGADENGEGGLEVENQPIRNSAGGPFADPLLRDVALKGIVIRRNEEGFDPQWANDWELAVNTEAFTVGGKIILPRRARIWEITAEPQVVGQGGACRFYQRVTYTIHLKKNGWRRRLFDQGLMYTSGDTTPPLLFHIEDTNGQPVSEPVPLNGFGQPLDPPYDDPKYVTYITYDEKDFSTLSLPRNEDGTG